MLRNQGYGCQLPTIPSAVIPPLEYCQPYAQLHLQTSPQPAAPIVTEQSPEPQQPQPQQEQDQHREQNNQANAPMDAGPGGAIMAARDDDNDRNRDWLDWLYFSMRGLMLISIVYFYSSTTRFFLVAVLGFIIYIYQAGWFATRRVPAGINVKFLK